MRPSKAHFVTSCQQLLALGAVLAVLTPAASVVSLDVVQTPGSSTPGAAPEPDSRHDRPQPGGVPGAPRTGHEGRAASTVPAEPVEPVVEEVALTAEQDGATDGEVEEETEQLTPTTVLSEPQPVTGYGAVGVTWSHDAQVADDRIDLEVRTATDGAWSGWSELEYHDEHAPEPETEEGRETRPGTDPLFVGEVDRVQLRAVAEDGLPDDMSLAVVAPGRAAHVQRQSPASGAEGAADDADPDASQEEAIELQAALTSSAKT
jgi:hypothetical protein